MEEENIFAMNEARKIAINKQRKAKISNISDSGPSGLMELKKSQVKHSMVLI